MNSKLSNIVQYSEMDVEIGLSLPEGGHSSGAVDVSKSFPSAKKIIAIGGRRSGTNYVCWATIENNKYLYCESASAGIYKVIIMAFY